MSAQVDSGARPPALSVEQATVAYDGKPALEDATLVLEPGTICGLVGMNGAGKSTLFKAIMGFVPMSQGRVLVHGAAVETARKRSQITYVPQSEEIDWDFPISVGDLVLQGRYGYMGLLRLPSAGDRAAVTEALERVGMSDFRRRQIGQLSGGQRKRAFLARALAQHGSLMLLDEPFVGIDVTSEQAIVGLLRELRDEGQTILVSTHDLDSIRRFCDHVALVNRTIVAFGPTDEVFTEANLARAFGGLIGLPSVSVAAGADA
jgi:ABC-type Mn2+/Zn2+ transport system ATPase subunit